MKTVRIVCDVCGKDIEPSNPPSHRVEVTVLNLLEGGDHAHGDVCSRKCARRFLIKFTNQLKDNGPE